MTEKTMRMKGMKRILLGEKMPDKNDPQYKARYERDVKAGRKFAKALRIDKAAAAVQHFADMHRTLFLVLVFSFVAISFGYNIYRIVNACKRPAVQQTATVRQDSVLKSVLRDFHGKGIQKSQPLNNEKQR